MKPFASFISETWRMELPDVDKMAKDNNGVRYVIVRQGLFDRTLVGAGMKTNDFKKTARAVFTNITERN